MINTINTTSALHSLNSFVSVLVVKDKATENLITICFVLVVILWILVETGFMYLVTSVVEPKLQPLRKPLACPVDPVDCIFRVMDSIDSLKSYTIDSYLSGFFRGANFKDIHCDNIRSFLAWAMYAKHVKDLSEIEVYKVGHAYDEVFRRHPVLNSLKPGFNPNIKHVAFNLEPIPYIHRPLLFYVSMGLIEIFSNALFLRTSGFQSLTVAGNSYWIKQGSRHAEPMLFFHGISSGWAFYTHLIKTLGKGRTILLVDLDATKIKSMAFNMPTPAQFTDTVLTILRRHRIKRVSVVGHSFGSISAGWLVSLHPEVVSHLTLLDPVSLLLALPDVAYNFLYRKPSTLTQWIIYLAAAREITISNMLFRHFAWHRNILWLEDIPADIGVVVGVASKDEITSPYAILEYIQNCRAQRIEALQRTSSESVAMIEGVMWDNYSHGQILLGGAQMDDFVRLVSNSEKVFGKGY